MCSRMHGESEGLVSIERWSCSRGTSFVIECMGNLRYWSQ